jgi:ribosomal protein L37AE/L43A
MRFIPHWRKATWAVVIWTVLMATWIASGVSATSSNCTGKTGNDLAVCQTGTAVGAGIGVTLIFLIWFIGFVVFSLIWLMSRPDRRLCPVCGEQVKKGLTVCPKCGYNFAATLSQPAVARVPQCPRCHAPIAMGQPTCSNCGLAIDWGAQPSSPPQG